eukprot:1548574-Prymnesium_polylepis.1
MLGAEDGCNHPQPTGSIRPLICGREACFWAFLGRMGRVFPCIRRNVKTTLRDPPSAAARLIDDPCLISPICRPHRSRGRDKTRS